MNGIPTSPTGTRTGDKALIILSQLIADRLKEMQVVNWESSWRGISELRKPVNLIGQKYNFINCFFLQLDAIKQGYASSVYMTRKQAESHGLVIVNNGRSMPVLYYESIEYENEGDDEVYDGEILNAFFVYNLDQTNLSVVNRELYNQIVERTNSPEVITDLVIYEPKAMTVLSENKEWPLTMQPEDDIDVNSCELAVELATAVFLSSMGKDTRIQNVNATVYEAWIKGLSSSPDYLRSIMPLLNRMLSGIESKYDSACLDLEFK